MFGGQQAGDAQDEELSGLGYSRQPAG